MPTSIKQLSGPKGSPILGNLFKLDLPNLHRQLEDWSDEYGDVYRLNLGYTDHMIVTRPSIVQAICASRPDEFVRMRKMDRVIKEGGVYGVFNAEGDEWRLHRKIVTKGLDVSHQKEFFPAMEKVLERLYNKWKQEADKGEPFDLQNDLLRFTVDITSSLAFGVEMNTIEQEGGVIQDHMEKVFPMIFHRLNMPIPWYRLMRSKKDKEFDAAVGEMNKLVDEFISRGQQRLKDNPELRINPSNLLESILIAAEEEDAFTDKQVRGNLLTLLLAGEDTTANSLSWLIYLLADQAEIRNQLAQEAREVLGNDHWIKEYGDVSKLKYTEATAVESMRFKPVAPILIFESTRDQEIEGIEIKKGQVIITNWRNAALKDEFFTQASSFMPERWMKASKCPVHNTDAYTPFGSGPRFCPGRNLAILEMRMVISMLFKNFDVEMVTPAEDVKEIMAFTMMASEYRVRLTHRKSS